MILVVAAGCGGKAPEPRLPSTAAEGAQPGSTPAGGRTLPRPFERPRDAPPAGIARQVEYFQQGGPPICRERDASALTLSYGVGALPRGNGDLLHPKPRIGDFIKLCVLGLQGTEEFTVSIDAPGVDPKRWTGQGNGATPSSASTFMVLMPRYQAGRWRIRATTGDRTTELDLMVRPAAAPGYRGIRTTKREAVFLLVGLRPRQRFALHIYEPRGEELIADYLASLHGRAGADGSRLFSFDPRGAGTGCYIAKAEVAGQILDDKNNTLSTFCPFPAY